MNDIQVYQPGALKVSESLGGGGLEGAERTSRETALWSPAMGSPDTIINRVKPLGDARGRDLANNDGYTHGAREGRKDGIVGSRYRLNAKPHFKVLARLLANKAFDDKWAEEFQQVTEGRFDLIAESERGWLDVTGHNTLTDMARLAIASDFITGEVCAVPLWMSKDRSRPINTCIQMIASARLCNKDGMPDTQNLKRGVQKDDRGRAIGYWVRNSHPYDYAIMGVDAYSWTFIPAFKPWGRRTFIHIYEQNEPDQSRGIADIVSVLKSHRMTQNLDDVSLQRAVIDASYASSLESDLPPEVIFSAMGGGSGAENFANGYGLYLSLLKTFFDNANNVAVDGVKMPVLPPGTKMKVNSLATPGGLGTDFGKSVLRRTAAGLGVSGEEFSHNFSETSYSGLKGAFAVTERSMSARKRRTADRFCNMAYELYVEEDMGAGQLPLPRGVHPDVFYEALAKEAFCRASWIGTGAGQIDELKETQAAILRIKSGLSTYEKECARLGEDFRETFDQIAREQAIIAAKNISISTDTSKKGSMNDNSQTDGPGAKPTKKKDKAAA